jgi:heme-degrading monooxygenase HmoA
MFIAMNQFRVNPDRAPEFEAAWQNRESYLQQVPGFVRFALLRGDEPGEYISHSTWESRDDFLGWARSDAFRRAHEMPIAEGLVLGHPRARFYEAVIEEAAGQPALG